jgi:hypothetical protein
MAPHHRKACGRIARYRFVEETQDTASLLQVPVFSKKIYLSTHFKRLNFRTSRNGSSVLKAP